jgi:phage shock protein A
LGSAADSLKRIRERQSVREEKFKAHAEIEERRTGADLDNKLRDAGILPGQTNAADVLARLMQPKDETVTEAPPLQIQQAEPVPVKRGES